ncbi:phage tail protein [Vibrio crassostreae]|uniref:phage tail-collar fiber domain-containing protein n=1 Tax=Vibrio crassostreae TaxID=246167 RepID=UPI001B30D749|nr:phage tail protein [Vibrio crassostreae]CAK2307177.1 Phage tail protein [Vibrio crassostreae]CAK2431166.1 Phage tail protein [Vibrio crassostreae]CAK2456444.1 Phage tail protein [Vibrio crassostreae]CAK2606621.1 Phage tail protein [Vibrio crassostreae]CAK2694063.1 Phage tail protein [Vibrio crassostreae]
MSLGSAQEHTAVLTDKGKELLEAAYQSGQKLLIEQMSLGDANGSSVTPTPDVTQLVNEFGRQDINEGNTQEHWFNAIVYVDASRFAEHFINEFGLHDSDGNLIVYSSYPSTLIPSVDNQYVQIEIECSMDLYQASAVTINITPIIPHATELESGIASIATDAQVDAGTDDSAFLTIKKLLRRAATTSLAGVVQLSNNYKGTSQTKAVTEKALSEGLTPMFNPENPQLLGALNLYVFFTANEGEQINWELPDEVIGSSFVLVDIKTTIQYERNIKLRAASNWSPTSNSSGGHHKQFNFTAGASGDEHGTLQTILIPCVTENKKPVKGMKFTLSRNLTRPGEVAPTFEITVKSAWK